MCLASSFPVLFPGGVMLLSQKIPSGFDHRELQNDFSVEMVNTNIISNSMAKASNL